MKLAPRDAPGFLARPDPRVPGLLIWGADPMRVAERRQTLIRALIGPAGEAEMRLARFPAADLRKDPAAALDAVKAQGFFAGPRAVLIEEAADAAAPALAPALADWAPGDAMLVVTGGVLPASSKLRKLFEGDKRAFALAVYDDPPGQAEISAMLQAEGLGDIPSDAMRDLSALAQTIEPGDFRQTLQRIALYKLGDPAPLTPVEIAALAPMGGEADVDDVLNAVSEGRAAEVAPLMARLAAQGVAPVALCIGAIRHFRLLHGLLADPRGPAQAVERMRPPVYGPRRNRLLRQAQRWSLAQVEEALSQLVETDLTLRSSSRAPLAAVLQRTLIRLSMIGARRIDA
ncbi:DNA polymerase III subunit delta [Pararhodobacter sp. SW119]|uniref:DNA polymerase III subunit delta n=1 Tax=Pararhodobacter sp. SW119 TaxID=2780075 RepID=UPI001ADF371F|nr:DNA polymerase III subunit delta [Pararhodobacter sp. SW119]